MAKKAAPFKNLVALGKRLETIRIKAELNQKEAGQLVGVSDASVSNWEKGKTEPPLAYLTYLAENYVCDLNWLLLGVGLQLGDDDSEKLELYRENRRLTKENEQLKKEIQDTGFQISTAQDAHGEESAEK